MVGSSILPISFHRGKLYFLFGKENELEKSAQGFSDFGGGMEKGENAFETACREGGEELTGFLGDASKIKEYINKNGGYLKLGDPDKYNIHIIRLNYDPKLPEYYNNNHRFLWDHMEHSVLSRTKLFEKIEIQWFSVEEARRRIKEFRPFYQEILLNNLLAPQKLKEIRDFFGGAADNIVKSRKTKRRRQRITSSRKSYRYFKK